MGPHAAAAASVITCRTSEPSAQCDARGDAETHASPPRRPWLGVLFGGLAALILVVAFGILLTFCGLGDGPLTSRCEREAAAAPWIAGGGAVIVICTAVAALPHPQRAWIRRALWATPTLMLAVVIGSANTVLA